jgi:hypothetical protein
MTDVVTPMTDDPHVRHIEPARFLHGHLETDVARIELRQWFASYWSGAVPFATLETMGRMA